MSLECLTSARAFSTPRARHVSASLAMVGDKQLGNSEIHPRAPRIPTATRRQHPISQTAIHYDILGSGCLSESNKQSRRLSPNLMVSSRPGLEPGCLCGRRILSALRLPFRHGRRGQDTSPERPRAIDRDSFGDTTLSFQRQVQASRLGGGRAFMAEDASHLFQGPPLFHAHAGEGVTEIMKPKIARSSRLFSDFAPCRGRGWNR